MDRALFAPPMRLRFQAAARACAICGEDFELVPGKRGRINECPSCARDIELLVASDGDPDGNDWQPVPASTRRIYGRARVEQAEES